MSDIVIRAEGLGKRYLIGHQSAEREQYTVLRDVVGRSLKGLGRSAVDMVRGRQIIAGDEIEAFWALKDVSFEVKRGEVLGIIGRNGAGKSTLLKILSRITEPTEGRVTIDGRVASLLEVGTGFHPELTGRENIFLNGAILGMTRAEIRRKFDEIVAFAGVEKFLDTPVKRYSSGMYVRLAFSVAAHLEPEILVVDEVLAVGDAEFQKKCLGKMKDVSGHGRTVLFVSHNMAAVQSLCSRALILQSGTVAKDGTTSEAVSTYFNEQQTALEADLSIHRNREKAAGPKALRHVSLYPTGTREPQTTHPLIIRVIVDARQLPAQVRSQPQVTCSFRDMHDCLAFTVVSSYQSEQPAGIESFEYEYECKIDQLPLTPGRYSLSVRFWTPGEMIDGISHALFFDVTWSDRPARLLPWSNALGPVFVDAGWCWQKLKA